MANGERVGYNDTTNHVEISAQSRAIGPKAYELFRKKIIRPLPWDIKDGKITVTKKLDAHVELETVPGQPYVPDIQERVIITEGLENEQIDERLVRLCAVFKRVEDGLPDFMGRSTDITRNNMGLNMSYNQWGREELQHSLALGLILEATGNRTAQEIVDEYYRNIEQTWEPPFPSERELVAFAACQEPHTGGNYFRMEAEALRQDAPTVAKILHTIGKDEMYHAGGYRAFLRLYFEEDPEGTIADVVHVAKNFRMPMLNLIPNQRQAGIDLIRAGIVDRDTTANVIQRTLKGFGFVPEPLIAEAVSAHQK